jgi:hypothetical protein
MNKPSPLPADGQQFEKYSADQGRDGDGQFRMRAERASEKAATHSAIALAASRVAMKPNSTSADHELAAEAHRTAHYSNMSSKYAHDQEAGIDRSAGEIKSAKQHDSEARRHYSAAQDHIALSNKHTRMMND